VINVKSLNFKKKLYYLSFKEFLISILIIDYASNGVSAYSKRFKRSSEINLRSARYLKLIKLFQYSLPKSKIEILLAFYSKRNVSKPTKY
tara:strand:- start:778 stop:1047 length:270 start_codon:yes stop_codon:yes gene_type:complete